MTELESGIPEIWATLERIRRAIGMGEDEFRELLKLNPDRYQRLRTLRLSPPMTSIYALMDRVHVSFDNLISGNIDYKALALAFSGQMAARLPERYAEGAFSRRRTSINVLGYVEALKGWYKKDEVLRHFQVEERVFDQPEEWINIRFLTDVCRALRNSGFTTQNFSEMGKYATVTNRESIIGRELSKYRDLRELYLRVFDDLIVHFDANFDYRVLTITGSRIVVRAVPREQVQEALKTKNLGSEDVCTVKSQVGATLTQYIPGLPPASVCEWACIHKGDDACIFEWDFEVPQAVLAKKKSVSN